jgi:hypothetical protein
MKTRLLFPLFAGLFLAGLASQAVAAAPATAPTNVTVIYQDPDHFTDVRDSTSSFASTYYLDELKACLQQAASPLLAPGQKLTITISDIDLAGDIRPGSLTNVRIIKDIYIPHVALKFQLVDSAGKVVKEGDRRLTDLAFMQRLRIPGADEPLYYDKALLKDWVSSEFKSKT